MFREPFVFAGGEAGRNGASDSGYAGSEEQIRLPWNPEYDIWHSRWFPPDANPSLTADKMEFLEYFLNGKKWAVIHFLLQGDSRDKTCGSVRWKADRRT